MNQKYRQLSSVDSIKIDAEDLAVPEIEITNDDLRAEVTSLELLALTFEDLIKFSRSEISIDEKDLPPIIQIRMTDLPPIIHIKMADLPPDLNFMTTECYHGTSWAAAEEIRKEGFKVGAGAASGAGIYFSVGGMSIARSYAKTIKPCIVHARVNWGKVAYLDDPKIPGNFKGSGNRPTIAALSAGYDSFIATSKFSKSQPTVGIVLGKIGSYIRPPRIEVVELIDPNAKRPKRN